MSVINVENIAESAKLQTKKERNIIEVLCISAIGFISMALMFKTILVLGTSISNSGELNILSVLTIVAIDQFGVRIGFVLTTWVTCKIVNEVKKLNGTGEFVMVTYLCKEEVTDLMIEAEEERQKKLREMVASPPRKKTLSPSRVPKGLLSAERGTYLNLINLQASN